jgi:hypothetical protein
MMRGLDDVRRCLQTVRRSIVSTLTVVAFSDSETVSLRGDIQQKNI